MMFARADVERQRRAVLRRRIDGFEGGNPRVCNRHGGIGAELDARVFAVDPFEDVPRPSYRSAGPQGEARRSIIPKLALVPFAEVELPDLNVGEWFHSGFRNALLLLIAS